MMKCTNKRIGQLIGLYEFGGLQGPKLDRFLDHLVECEHCYEAVYTLEPFTSTFRRHREAVQRGEISPNMATLRSIIHRDARFRRLSLWWRKPVLIAASVLIVIGGAVLTSYLVQRWSGPSVDSLPGAVAPSAEIADRGPSPWQDVEVPKAPYLAPTEKGQHREVSPELNRAMTAYEEGNFVVAADQLDALSRIALTDAAEVNFYLGVSLLLASQSEDAIQPLEQAVRLNGYARRESSHYYLALAYLKTNRPRQALAELEAVIKMNGPHRAGAGKLKQDIVNQLPQNDRR
jgi:tetratricopeptide (TPR) repeat protein